MVSVILKLSDLPNLVWLLAGEGPTKAELAAALEHHKGVGCCRCNRPSA